MKNPSPNQYIRLQRKICNNDVINVAHKMASEKGLTPPEFCYQFLCEQLLKEEKKRTDLFKTLAAFNK